MDKLNFRVIDLGTNIDLPVIRETGYREWIEFGMNNKFPQFLIEVYHMKSITLKTIINRKVKMINGGGWKEATTPELKQFIENKFNDDTLTDILFKISFDLEIFGGYALNIIWNANGDRISEISHIPFECVRIDKSNRKNNINYYWVSSDWSDRKSIPKKYQQFSEKYKENKSQILYVTEYQPGSNLYYPIPNYYSSLNYAISEWEISNFHRATIQSGFSAGFILNFATGIPTEEEMEAAYKEIERKYTGTWNAGKFILTFSNGQDGAPTLNPIPLSDTDSRYKELDELIKSSIFIGSEVTSPELFGVSTPGKLGNKQELLESLEIFQASYINFKQESIERVFNKLAKINGITEDMYIKKYTIDIQKITE